VTKKPLPTPMPTPDDKMPKKKGKKVVKGKVKLPKKKTGKLVPIAAMKGKTKVQCPGCGAVVHDKHNFCPECGKKLPADARVIDKNHDYRCLGCDYELDKGEQFCPGCGKKNPGYLPEADTKVKTQKGKKGRSPGAGVTGRGAADIKGLPAHREPDGEAVEAFEHDASLEDGDESRKAVDIALHLKSLGVPENLGALHDLTCAAYHPASADKAHPGASIAGIDTAWWQQKALDMAASAPMDEAREAAQLWQTAIALKNADPVEIAEIRGDMHKSFQDANPGPGSAPQPGMLCAGDFKRPYLTEGRANPGTGYGGPHTFNRFGHDIEASDFERGHLDAGHAADSPANKGAAPIIEPAPLPPGMSRTFYRNASRDAARSAMGAMHDHIAQTFPDLCPMEGPGKGGEPAEGARPVPVPGSANKSKKGGKTVAKTKKEPVAEKSAKSAKDTKKPVVKDATSKKTVVTKSAAVDSKLVKAAVAEATGPLADKVKSVVKQLKDAQRRNKKLQARFDKLGSLPDPREAPFKGIAQQTPSSLSKSAKALPAGARSVAEYAEQVKLNEIRAMQEQARSHDSAEREAAWNVLMKMGGLPTMNK